AYTVPDPIERYELASEIGHGGMATVYRARDTRLDRWVAVKLMHPHLRGTSQARARFAREARAVAKLKHPSILEIYDYSGSDSDNAFIATELLTGPTLRAFVERVGEVPAEVAGCVGVSLASALSAAHAQGIIHRDVKPENVLLHEEHLLKLTDFGIADMVDPSMSAMTATGQILGSPAHMAPEQVEGGQCDARTDVFALGTILYWLATGELPFTGKNPHQVLKRVVEASPIDPLLVRPRIGRPLRDIILRCMEKDPQRRYQTADALEQALRSMLQASGLADPLATLAAYLRDPAQEAPRILAQVQTQLLADARSALAAGQRARVMEYLDRILAADERQPEALALLSRVERDGRLRTLGAGVFALVAALACVALWVFFAPKPPPHRDVAPPKAPEARPLATSNAGQPPPPDGIPARPQTPDPVEKTQQRAAPRLKPPSAVASTKLRTVVFAPEPANVTISIDGAEPHSFGPAFRSVELSPGSHSFHFVGARNCCEDATLTVDLPGGPGETSVAPRLAYRQARVYVASNVPADVSIDGVGVGRARSLLSVPRLRALAERRQISVSAPGYAPYSGIVELRAGEVTELDLHLEPSAAH
ncbi:MAG: hypothetical protein RL385_6000, partial [Pseudomonadota bacterium]